VSYFPSLNFMQLGFFGKKAQAAAGGAPDNPNGYANIKRFFGFKTKPLQEPTELFNVGSRGGEKPMLLPVKPPPPPPRWKCQFKADLEMRDNRNCQVIITRDWAKDQDRMTQEELEKKYGADFRRWCATLKREIKTKRFHDSDRALIRTADVSYVLFSIRQWVDDTDAGPR
jgi:hypothetical protein